MSAAFPGGIVQCHLREKVSGLTCACGSSTAYCVSCHPFYLVGAMILLQMQQLEAEVGIPFFIGDHASCIHSKAQ